MTTTETPNPRNDEWFIAHDGQCCVGIGNTAEEAMEEPRNIGVAESCRVYRTDYDTATTLFDTFGAAELVFTGDTARLRMVGEAA